MILREQSLSMAGTGEEEICEKLRIILGPLQKIETISYPMNFFTKLFTPWTGKLINDNVDNVKQSSLRHDLI